MSETMYRVNAIEKESVDRSSEKDRFPTTVTLLGYESPRMYEKPPST
jgi:hypothetical protein